MAFLKKLWLTQGCIVLTRGGLLEKKNSGDDWSAFFPEWLLASCLGYDLARKWALLMLDEVVNECVLWGFCLCAFSTELAEHIFGLNPLQSSSRHLNSVLVHIKLATSAPKALGVWFPLTLLHFFI